MVKAETEAGLPSTVSFHREGTASALPSGTAAEPLPAPSDWPVVMWMV